MEYIDLHVHTTASDGTFTPVELVKYASNKGLSAIAITDHDTVDGIDAAINAAKNLNIKIIPGIEFSAEYSGQEIHLLGYFINYHDADFLEALKPIKDSRTNRNIRMIDQLNAYGIDISIDQLKKRFSNSTITRAHIAKYMIEKGIVRDKKEAFDKYIGKDRPFYIRRDKIPSSYAIQLIKSVQGIPVLAHPMHYHFGPSPTLPEMLEDLKIQGLQGIEAIYSTHTKEEELYLKKLAKELNLLITGGSDFHGNIKPNIDLGKGKGNLRIPKDLLDVLGGFHD